MTDAAHGDFLPPTPGGEDATAHEIAAARAQAAAAARVRVSTVTDVRAASDYTGLVTRAIGFGIDAVIIDLTAIVVAAIVALALSMFNVPSEIDTALAAIGAVVFIVWSAAYFVRSGRRPARRQARASCGSACSPRARRTVTSAHGVRC